MYEAIITFTDGSHFTFSYAERVSWKNAAGVVELSIEDFVTRPHLNKDDICLSSSDKSSIIMIKGGEVRFIDFAKKT